MSSACCKCRQLLWGSQRSIKGSEVSRISRHLHGSQPSAPTPRAFFCAIFFLCLGVRVCVCGGGGGSCTLSSPTVAMLRNSRLTPTAPVAVTTVLMLWCNIKAPTSVISNSLSWWLIIGFKMWTLLGRAWKIVYRLIILLLSTEIFSKRRKIYSLWRETRVPNWMAKKQVNDVKTAE